MSNQLPYTDNGFDLTTFHESLEEQFHQSVSDYAETEMLSVYKDEQNEAFTEAVSKQINLFDITLNNI